VEKWSREVCCIILELGSSLTTSNNCGRFVDKNDALGGEYGIYVKVF
jgi:hypothetical protein